MAGASDNDGRPPGGESPDDLPDLPEEWGVIVIPDDLSELADEVEAVRAELRTGPPLTRWQLFVRRPAIRRTRRFGSLLMRTPALIVSVAVLVTIASLFASAWPGPARQPATQRTSGTTESRVGRLPALDLIGADGQSASILGSLPAVLLLTDGCDCARLLDDTVAAAAPGVTVLVITTRGLSASPSTTTSSLSASPPVSAGVLPTLPTAHAGGKTVTFLQDRTDTLRHQLDLSDPDGTAAAILVDKTGEIVRIHPRTASIETIRPDLARL
ncbi:hypothetical protein [Actinoplanes derwentensis]|uniref:Uncharacterized protein n=1 Tax=Actinoplanes derwentensis TaxID=113562 RepID=A0A1H2CYD5_9ACTN|nr:hypothetical protein [Actinoplanes derwentensis]GID82942.1 hypothetical protein Ade03nite_18660 [Actinoplanes derwentensis]SDT75515.1 hypothetical protein SAMN04489716_7325 [Actinoplanes derwentensis]